MESMDDWDMIATAVNGPVKTHGPSQCAGSTCCIHNPSDHHMVAWPIHFDMKKAALALRMCEHGYPHPDPDSLRYFANNPAIPSRILAWFALHQCDGCCLPDTIPE
jgi:hypothetical protein